LGPTRNEGLAKLDMLRAEFEAGEDMALDKRQRRA